MDTRRHVYALPKGRMGVFDLYILQTPKPLQHRISQRGRVVDIAMDRPYVCAGTYFGGLLRLRPAPPLSLVVEYGDSHPGGIP